MLSGPHIVAIDCGTQSVRCLIVDVSTGQHVIGATEPIILSRSGPDVIEVDADHLADATVRVLKATLAMRENPPVAIAITNMRETAICWSRKTGRPVHNAITWMSNQSQNIVQRWDDAGIAPLIRDRTGLSNHPFFFGSKIAWLFDKYPELKRQAQNGELAVGTVESWLLHVLTSGAVHATDLSNASRYQLLNLSTLNWDEEVARAVGIPLAVLPELRPTSDRFGVTNSSIVGMSVPITGMIGDQQASLLGHGALKIGDAKATFGTSCAVCVNLGPTPSLAPGLVTSVAWANRPGEAVYEMEGSAFHSGYTMAWLSRMLSLPISEQNAFSHSPLSADRRVSIVPAFSGMGAPTWLAGAGASISGLTMDTDQTDIFRAGIESMAFQAFDLIAAMPVAVGGDLSLSVDGGAASNDYLCQSLADLSGRTILRPPSRELTGLGAAIVAATTLDLPITIDTTDAEHTSERFVPRHDTSYMRDGFAHWKKTVLQHLT